MKELPGFCNGRLTLVLLARPQLNGCSQCRYHGQHPTVKLSVQVAQRLGDLLKSQSWIPQFLLKRVMSNNFNLNLTVEVSISLASMRMIMMDVPHLEEFLL